jgi:hypothetical protein
MTKSFAAIFCVRIISKIISSAGNRKLKKKEILRCAQNDNVGDTLQGTAGGAEPRPYAPY